MNDMLKMWKPKSIVLHVYKVKEWLEENSVEIYQVIYMRTMEVLIFYREIK